MSDIEISYFYNGKETSPDLLNRRLRRTLEAAGQKSARKVAHLVHPETGERPRIELHIDQARLVPKVTLQLRTDSPVMRAWLKEQGVVIEDISKDVT